MCFRYNVTPMSLSYHKRTYTSIILLKLPLSYSFQSSSAEMMFHQFWYPAYFLAVFPDGFLFLSSISNWLPVPQQRSVFLLILIQAEKAFSGTEKPKKTCNKGLPRSIADFVKPLIRIFLSGKNTVWQLYAGNVHIHGIPVRFKARDHIFVRLLQTIDTHIFR